MFYYIFEQAPTKTYSNTGNEMTIWLIIPH